MGAHTHLLHHRHFSNTWRIWLAELGVVILAVLGLYCAISEWLHGDVEGGLIALGWLAGTATIYAFGYLWCLPDVLGGIAPDQSRTLRQRWSDFALLSTFIAILVIAAAYVRVIWVNYSDVRLAFALALVLASCWLLPACVVASEKYLGWTMPCSEGKGGVGWRAGVRGATRNWGNWLINALGVTRAVVIGALLALMSLIVVVRGEIFGPDYKGYEIVAGSGAWPIVEGMGQSAVVVMLVQVHRGFYVLGLVVAALALAGLVPGRLVRIIPSRILAVLAGAIALFEITNVAVASGGVYELFLTGVWTWVIPVVILTWAVPPIVWLMGIRNSQDNWDHTRLSVMVFYLPIFFQGFAFSVFLTYFSPGFGSFLVGMLLVWWGLVQRQREIASRQDPHAP